MASTGTLRGGSRALPRAGPTPQAEADNTNFHPFCAGWKRHPAEEMGHTVQLHTREADEKENTSAWQDTNSPFEKCSNTLEVQSGEWVFI